MEGTKQKKETTVRQFIRKSWMVLLLAAIAAAFGVTAKFLHEANEQKLTLREQVERQNELIAALQDQQEREKDKEVRVSVATDTIRQQLNSVSELVTQEYVYTNAAKKESSETWLWGMVRPFSGKSILITYDGVIKAGVDLSQAKIDVDEQKRTVTVTLPPSRITENNIPQETVNVVEIKNGLFNEVTMENYNDFVAEQKPVMAQKAIDQGILTSADRDAKAFVRSVLSVLPGMENYTLTVAQAN